MDLNLLRSAITLVLTLAFVGLWIAVWSKSKKAVYDRASRLPLEEDVEGPDS